MQHDRVFIVHLRRSRTKADGRHDPFWELGSFGITDCHGSNLLNPQKASRLEGARLAFAQGGRLGTRLLYLTPPIQFELRDHFSGTKQLTEVRWSPAEMPFRYDAAPILASNADSSDFPQLEKTLLGNRKTLEGQFASRFRSCTKELAPVLAKELIRKYEIFRSKASGSIAESYEDALPDKLLSPDLHRKRTYLTWRKYPGASPSELDLAEGYAANKRRSRKVCQGFAFVDAEVGGDEPRMRSRRKC